MAENDTGRMALEALTLITSALTKLDVGQIAVVSFGKNIEPLHHFNQPFTTEQSGPQILSQFKFDQQETNLATFLETSITMLNVAKEEHAISNTNTNTTCQQLIFIVSDGRVLEKDTQKVKHWIREAEDRNQLIVFIIIDNAKSSIFDVKVYNVIDGKMQFTPYMDKFPFVYYIVVRNIETIPITLADALRQWFEMMSQTNN
eukprot:TRINITY_DN1621_c0_g1_i1.p1 TRINITY_DN1621_c0_g1~~TRINITY_DN1621_c0_g1_i1.p1  ORF type:complete len:202 (+),score=98.71 TRINITY_DN1621_c0_g1_i1:95-700(+)